MVVKPKSKTQPVKKATKPKVIPKKPVATPSTGAKTEIQTVVELHTQQLKKLDEMNASLQKELKDIKQLLGSKSVAIPKSAPAKAPVKKVQKVVSKPVVKPKVTKSAASTVKKIVKPAITKSFADDLIEIPKDISDRINALTSKKKVTQTQLGKEVDLSQKAIHEIAARKKKDLNKDVIKKIQIVLKKYESK